MFLYTSAIVLAVVPIIAAAGRQGDHRSLADKLRYGPGDANHPVHVVPSDNVRIPKGWPVDTDGSITCRTCHEQLPSLEGGGNAHLRDFDDERAVSGGFCTKCHTEANGRSAAAMHWQAMRVAHVGSGTVSPGHGGRSMDGPSRNCMMCHDGVNAAESRVGTSGNLGGGAIGDPGRSHPVGVPYPSGSTRGRESQYRPITFLPRNIRLPEGKVSCVSCHNLYGGQPKLLSAPIEGSKLCFSCHSI